ncbi:DOA4 [Candida pseudojiufengensis]|uniref:DOA4 n=1 Tax=Candida pseudojiufengensis TaxID=497109 RepID=UPI0022250D0C|nr:DOA4 [Candida pseudojiufengensis]KAI5962298.1 DOA4 [Candida pseudojiufengensis]
MLKSELEVIQSKLLTKLINVSTTNKQINEILATLLEQLNYQLNLYDKLGYCDYDVAYAISNLVINYFSQIKQKIKTQSTALFYEFQRVVDQKAELGLKLKHINKGFQEQISPQELQKLKNVLIIDYRPKNLYQKSHIKNSVNLDPVIVIDVQNDEELEDKIQNTITYKQFQKFQERHKFDNVVIYDQESGDGRFNDIPGKNPFNRLIDLLMFQNKYLSSRLKKVPSYLTGGFESWKAQGLETITGAEEEKILRSDDSSFTNLLSNGSYSNGKSQNENQLNSQESLQFSYNSPKSSPQISQAPLLPTKINPKPRPHPQPQPQTQLTKITPTTVSTNKFSTNSAPKTPQFTTGLVNLGNSCYMNCMIQCLVSTPLTPFFFTPFKQHINYDNILGTKGRLTIGFADLINNMLKNKNGIYNPKNFRNLIGQFSQQFNSCDQQDCIEFVNFLLDGIHEDLNQMAKLNPKEKQKITELTPEQEKSREILPIRQASTIEWERYLKLNFSIVVDQFQGQYSSQLKCLTCQFTSTSYNAFSILSVPVPNKEKVTLQDCINEFLTTELLDDNDKWFCPNCKTHRKSTKKIAITRLPQVLIINFKRFKMQSTSIKKLETWVTYPVDEILDLTKYWPTDGMNDLGSLPIRNQIPPFEYKLFGVANHFGSLTTGHYTSYVKKQDKQWYYFDDTKVSRVNSNQVMNKNAYCLFFQRI